MFKKLSLTLALILSSVVAVAQSIPGPGGRVSFPAVSATGQDGSTVSYLSSTLSPSTYTVDWSVSGTAPTACTFQPQGSSDDVHWYALSASGTCTASGVQFITGEPVVFFRLNVVTYTAGDATTSVVFNYTRGQ